MFQQRLFSASRSFIIGLTVLAPWSVQALEVTPYDSQKFIAAQSAGKPVALHFHADWCSTCKVQERVLNDLKKEPNLDIQVLMVDYDNEKQLRKDYKIKYQSTMVIFRGKNETARVLGDTDPEKIKAGLRTALTQ